ncbi:PucR family transcriptional regulator ligand-binding domain-containing protein [Clostridia bacterium]|nr:PucR family transcriptional regulator ligand-binding domain-containing protein [Clostridia bacterium]
MTDMTIKDLLECKFFQGTQLVAGEGGIENPILSVTVLDSPDGVGYLKGGELILSTGYCLKSGEKMQMNIVQKLAEHGASGLAMTLRYFDNQLPRAIKDTANRVGLPIIILKNGFSYVEISDFISSYKTRRLQKGFKEINNALYVDGLAGIAEMLNKYTGLQVVLLFGENKYVAPSDFEIPSYLLDQRLWFINDKREIKCQDVEAYTRECGGEKKEWLGAKIHTQDKDGGHIILLKGEKEFSLEEERLLDYAASVCALEANFIKSLIAIQRKHKRKFLEGLFKGDYSFEEAINQAKKLNYCIPREGVVLVYRLDVELETIDEEALEYQGKIIFGNDVVQGLMDAKYYAVLSEYNQETIEKAESLRNKVSEDYGDSTVFVGIGRPGDYSNIAKSYSEAKGAIRIGACCDLDSSVYDFNNLGFYRLLLSTDLDAEMYRFYEDYLQPLMLNDAEHNSNLVETLKCLIHSNYKHRVAAAEMYVHPNTIRYRIKIIEKLCHINLDLPNNRLLMEIAVKILPLIDIEKLKKECFSNKI